MATPTPRVLSIQSHVVHGHVGNKCAVLPLNRLGFEVDAINSVQFSNHTGYPVFKGSVMDGAALTELVAGLEANGLLHYTHLLTGYIGSLSLLETVAIIVGKLREVNPDAIYGANSVSLSVLPPPAAEASATISSKLTYSGAPFTSFCSVRPCAGRRWPSLLPPRAASRLSRPYPPRRLSRHPKPV